MPIKKKEPTIRTVDVTPDMALEWLAANENNRTVSPKHIAMLADLMASGQFHFVGDPIRFDVDGVLLDGQHRLSAIIESETTQRMVVVEGLPPESQLFMDTGRRRSPGDQLKVTLGMRDGNHAAAIARTYLRWKSGNMISSTRTFSVPELVTWAADNEVVLTEAVRRARTVTRAVRGSVPVCGAAFIAACDIDPVTANEFWDRLADGAGLEPGSPILALREVVNRRAKRERWPQYEELAMYVRAWNAHRRGERMVRLQHGRGGITNNHLIMR